MDGIVIKIVVVILRNNYTGMYKNINHTNITKNENRNKGTRRKRIKIQEFQVVRLGC